MKKKLEFTDLLQAREQLEPRRVLLVSWYGIRVYCNYNNRTYIVIDNDSPEVTFDTLWQVFQTYFE
jgi:hypothetical protein